MPDQSSASNPIAELCPQCGLCCNGVLFADVELQRGDDLRQAIAAGLHVKVSAKGKKVRLLQPCACFEGSLCRIYPDRPSRCRAFECRLLQDVRSGSRTSAFALQRIAAARQGVGTVTKLLHASGQGDERLPLTKRYSQVMAQPLELAGDPKLVKIRRRLSMAMDRLMRRLHRDFLS